MTLPSATAAEAADRAVRTARRSRSVARVVMVVRNIVGRGKDARAECGGDGWLEGR